MVLRDFTYAARTLAKSPVFAATAIVTIALGIGASTAIFSVTNAVLLRPLPYKNPDRLFFAISDMRKRNVKDFPFSNADFIDLRNGAAPMFQEMVADPHRRGYTELLPADGRSNRAGPRLQRFRWTAATRTAGASRRRARVANRTGSAAAAGDGDPELRILAAALRWERIHCGAQCPAQLAGREARRSWACCSPALSCCFRPTPTWSSGRIIPQGRRPAARLVTFLDTSLLMDALTGPKRFAAALRHTIQDGERILLSSLVLYAWSSGPRLPQELAAQEALFPSETAIPFGWQESALSAKLYRSLHRARGREMDIAIAACAINHEAALWTLNTAGF